MTSDAQPVRWRQRLDEFGRMLDLFRRTDAIQRDRPLTEAEEGGLVQFFELSVELGWKTLAAYLQAEGTVLKVPAPLNIIREAARIQLVDDPDIWVVAVERRNRMSHTYDPDAFRVLIEDAAARFLPGLEGTYQKLLRLAEP